jgi:hypothetical protein
VTNVYTVSKFNRQPGDERKADDNRVSNNGLLFQHKYQSTMSGRFVPTQAWKDHHDEVLSQSAPFKATSKA